MRKDNEKMIVSNVWDKKKTAYEFLKNKKGFLHGKCSVDVSVNEAGIKV